MKKLYVLVALLGCFGIQISWAQQKSISGTVFDETGGPLPGATIIVEGSSRGVATVLLSGLFYAIIFKRILCSASKGFKALTP